MKPAWYTNKWISFLMHAASWILLFSLPFLLRPSYNANEGVHPKAANDLANTIVARINDALLISFFYLNGMILVPRLLYKKKYLAYFLALSGCFAMLFLQGAVLRTYYSHDANFTFRKHLLFSVFIFLFILSCSIAYRTIRDRVLAERHAQEKENEFLKTELSLLRSQVSPHFMFNVLNNMVALARKQSDQLEPSLIKLSSLMRYMLYDTEEEKVTLEKETEYLQSYIDLQQQRFGKKVCVHVNLASADKTYYIEPMLLIPFVENAFKHGTGMIEDATIDIELRAEQDLLRFRVQNKFNALSTEVRDRASGIGLANVQRRLNLLYEKDHKLWIGKNAGFFTVSLQIHLS